MTVKEMCEKLNMEVLSGQSGIEKEITGGYCSDLLSDVMGNADTGNLWITIQVHKNILAVASLKELSAIIVAKGLTPQADTLEASNQENIPIIRSELPAFELAGKIHDLIK